MGHGPGVEVWKDVGSTRTLYEQASGLTGSRKRVSRTLAPWA